MALENKLRFIDSIPVRVTPHPMVDEWWNVVCGNSRMSTTRAYDHEPTEDDLKDAVRRHRLSFERRIR